MSVNQNKQLNRGEKSRTEYSARNTTVAIAARIIAILLGFCTRVVFTHTLSEEYVGINGLFTDILNVLALSELGIGTAISYALYKPIAENNIEKQKSLMRLYRGFYRVVACVVLIAGLLVIPFMDVLIKEQTQVEHLTFLYLMYLANSVISYLLVYKRTLVEAYQLSYIGVLYQTCFLIIQNVTQMLVLLTTRNFTLFLGILILCTLLNNLCISGKANKMYPFLKEKQIQPLSGEEKQGIYQNIRAMLLHKIGNVVVNNTDNLLLSSIIGVISVGIYSNYYLIIGSVRQVLNQAFQGITASVGNLGVEEKRERVQRIFECAFFIGQWMFGFATICLYELLTPFVELSFGAQYVFDMEITMILCLNFYFTGMRQATLVFRDSLGVFRYDRYKSLAEALINLVLSIALGFRYGVIGIFLGTLYSTLMTSLWVEPYMLYKHRLKSPVRFYFLKYGVYAAVTGIAWWITHLLCRQIGGSNVTVCIVRFALCLIIPNFLYLLVYGRSREFHLVMEKAKKMIFRHGRKDKNRKHVTHEEFSVQEKMLFQLVKESLFPDKIKETGRLTLSEPEWELLLQQAEKHGILSLLHTALCERRELPQNLVQKAENVATQMVLQQYHLLFTSHYMVNSLTGQGIFAIVLKGVTAGALYPVPELRKSGDVDLLLMNPSQVSRAIEILEKEGCIVKEKQAALHHVSFMTSEGMELELHTMLAEPFDNQKTNRLLQKILQELNGKTVQSNVMGLTFEVLPKAYFALELLLHMLQHFLRSGFGLKLLCDWVLFWNKEVTEQEKEEYLSLTERLGIRGFSDVITMVCVQFLGLEEEKISWMNCMPDCPVYEFMREILDAEEFGKSSTDRMVVLRGDGIFDYVRELHHQMQLSFPNAGKCMILWPGLWIVTIVRFLSNNRKVRKTSLGNIIREAARRSRLVRKMYLFR